jgi:ribosome-binding ATPase
MRIGIVGLPQAGKSTVFRLLAGHDPPAAKGPGPAVGVARVDDPRLDRLATLLGPKKITPVTIEILDFPSFGRPAKSGEAEGPLLAELRQVDLVLHVIRAFADARVPHLEETLDPVRDMAILETLFLVADLAVVEKRIGRIAEEARKGRKGEGQDELPLLERCRAALEQEQGLRQAPLSPAEEKRLRGYALLTLKPLFIFLNIGEEKITGADPVWVELEQRAALPRTGTTRVAARTEWELRQLPAEDRQEFARALGLETLGSISLLRRCLELMDLITFFTVVGDELRAWALPRGSTALEAAGTIHTDMAKGFIKAEVMPFDELEGSGSLAAARKAGRVRLEGKDYQVQEGEILTVRFSG